MFENIFYKRDVKKFYYWHQAYHKWMMSIAKADIPELEKELAAIELKKKQCVCNQFREYELDMLAGQEAIVRRIIMEIELGRYEHD